MFDASTDSRWLRSTAVLYSCPWKHVGASPLFPGPRGCTVSLHSAPPLPVWPCTVWVWCGIAHVASGGNGMGGTDRLVAWLSDAFVWYFPWRIPPRAGEGSGGPGGRSDGTPPPHPSSPAAAQHHSLSRDSGGLCQLFQSRVLEYAFVHICCLKGLLTGALLLGNLSLWCLYPFVFFGLVSTSRWYLAVWKWLRNRHDLFAVMYLCEMEFASLWFLKSASALVIRSDFVRAE